jgi:predicted transcriptional regulator
MQMVFIMDKDKMHYICFLSVITMKQVPQRTINFTKQRTLISVNSKMRLKYARYLLDI